MQKKVYNYAINVDSEAMKQFDSCLKEPFVISAALMPDAHSGYAAPIGSVLITKDYIVPAWVGFDIGCGMIAVKIFGISLEQIRNKQDKIYLAIKKRIPMGMGEFNRPEKITEKSKDDLQELIKNFQTQPHDKNILNFIKNSSMKHLGTLGGGNHFIELCHYKKEIWLVIHSGSRGLGYKVAEKYMQKASSSQEKSEIEKTFPLKADSQIGKEYLNILEFGLSYALLNRLEMSSQVVLALEEVFNKKIKSKLWANKNHNHAILEKGKFIHRKGATPAKLGELGIIPANMRDGCFLVKGLGNPKFLFSSSHGAGRAKSRSQARKQISLKQFQDSMKGIKGTIEEEFIDEAPMAYKDINQVMFAQNKSVKILKHILPVINWKGK